jgi:hypothetical protein
MTEQIPSRGIAPPEHGDDVVLVELTSTPESDYQRGRREVAGEIRGLLAQWALTEFPHERTSMLMRLDLAQLLTSLGCPPPEGD